MEKLNEPTSMFSTFASGSLFRSVFLSFLMFFMLSVSPIFAMNTSDITNNSVGSIVVGPSETDILVLDVTVVHTADTLVDADGTSTAGAGSSVLTAGTALYDVASTDLIFADSVTSPTKVWIGYIFNGMYTGAHAAGSTVGESESDISASLESLTNIKFRIAATVHGMPAKEST